MSGGYVLSPEDYAAPSLDDAPEAAVPAVRAAPAKQPDIKKAVAFAAAHFDVDPNVMAGMLMRESNLDPDMISGKRTSRAGAIGIAQFMPDTAKRYGIDPTDPVQSIMGMGAYLRDNLNKFGGDYEKAIAGYNWGENRRDYDAPDWKRTLPAETADYVGFVTAFARGMRGDAPSAAQDPARKPLPAGVTPSAAGAGRGVVNRGLVQPDTAPLESPSSDPMGSGAPEIMAQPTTAPLITRDPLSRAREPGSFDPGNAANLVQMSKSPQTLARERVALQMEASRSGAPTLKASPDASMFRNAMDATIAKPLDRSLPAAALEVAGDAARGVAGSSQILAGSVWSGLQAVADAAGGNEFARFAGEAGRAAREARTLGNNAADPTSLTKQVFESTFTSVPMMLAFSAAPLKAMMAQSAANEYGESADRGAGIEERTQRAVVMGLAEGIGERFGLPQLQSLFAKAAAKASTKELGHVLADMLVKEQIGEQVTQALQSGYEVAGQYGLKPDMTLPQYIDDAVNTAKVTFGQSLLTGGMAGGVKAMQGRPAISAADLARSKGFLDNGPGPATAPALTSTSFTPADSPSARAGLVDIVVPDAAPAARVSSEPLAETTLPLGTNSSAVNGDTDPAPPAPQSAEQGMAARLAAQFGIPPEEAIQAQPVEARGQVDRQPVADETQNAAATSEAVSAAPENHNADTATPTETWVGRRGDGYTTRGDAEQAVNGREKRFPDLTWKVEATSGGRFQLAGYAATPQVSLTTDGPIQQAATAAEQGRPQPDAMGPAVSTVRSPPATPALGAAATAQPAFEFNRNTDGTVTVKGDSAAIKAALPGFSGMPSKGGVLFGTRVADQVIEQLSPAQTASEALATAAPATVFKSRKEAVLAKQALGNEHRLQKMRAGYRLRLATDKELAASAKSGQRLRRGHATNLESDSLLTAISKNGGLAMAERADTIGEGNLNAGGKMLFTRSGRAIDEMARLLDEEGFIPPGEIESDGGVSWLQNAISDEIGGFRKHHSQAGEEWMRRARDEASGDAPDYEAAGVTDELLERVGYFASDADVQAAVDAVVTAGADVMAHQDTEAVERFWNSLAEVEQQEERNAIQAENHTANAQDATRRRYAQGPDAGEAQAGHRDRSRASFQEEADPAALTRTGAEQGAGSSSRRELQRQPVGAQGEESQRPDLTLTAPTKAQVLAQEAIRERERADKEAPADKPRSKFTGDQVDAFNTQGSVFDATADAVIDTLRFSKNGAAPDEAAALKALSENDDLFMLPKSDKTSVEGIAADNDPDIKVLPASFPGRRDFLLQLPSGKTARLMVRDASPYGPRVYGFNYEDGDALDMATERPGNNPEDVPADTGDVWLDVSLLESGEEGMLVYNIASTLAHNTGRIFIGDPAGLSNEAMRRRPEQMLSSALKFGTTAHLAPHPRQVSGDAALGVPAIEWVYGDHLGNIRRMIDVNLAALENAGADSISFDPTDGQFKDSDGQPISRADITALGSAGLGRAGLAGGTTIARGAVLRALLLEAGDGPQGSDGRRNGLLAGVVRQSAVHAQAVKRLFYSRSADERLDGRPLAQNGDLTPATALDPRGTRGAPALASRSELADALKTAFPTLGKAFDTMLARGERGQKGGLVTLDSADSRDMAQVLASKTPRTVAQALTLLGDGTMQTFESQDGDTQGFYDAKSGLTFVVLPNVSTATAPGVVLHELTHSQQRADIDAKAMALVDDRGSPYRPKATRDFLGRVAQRMADADESGNPQEATAYLVEQAVMEGRQEGFSAVDGGFMAWVDAKLGKAVGGVIRDLVAMVRDWALRRGVGITPTVDDLVAFARSSARAAARGDVVTSTAGDASSSSRADQTLTPAFRRWFGDSKIVDRSGQPRVMYRGDSRDIGPVLHPASGRRGLGLIFFSPSPSFAESYTKGGDGGNMTPAFIKAENPFDSSNKAHRDAVFQRLGETTLSDSSMAEGGWETLEDPDVVRAVKGAGFDGIYIFEDSEDDSEAFSVRNLAVFSSAQIKSATGNNGDFDPANPDIRRSVKRGESLSAKPPSETFTRKVQRYGQDAMNRFTVVQNWAAAQGVKLSDDADVWSFEERMHGRMASRLQDFREQTVQPIVKRIQAAGFSMAEVGEFLHMQHAEERNAQIAKLNPDFMDGSGIPSAAARKYLLAADPKLATVANELRAITESTLAVLLDAGIIHAGMTRAFAGSYRHYVPLKGTGKTATPGEPGNPRSSAKPGKGNSVDGDIERATGRSGGVDPFIVENILRGHESAIVQAEKNILGHSLLAFVTEIANPEVATVGDPEKRGVVKLGFLFEVTDDSAGNPTVYRTFDDEAAAYAWMGRQAERDAMRVRKTIANQQVDAQVGPLADNEVKVYVAGHAIKVQLNDEGLSRAYQKLGIDKLPIYLAMGREINRFLSKAYTGLNPEFSVVNPVRDFTTGVLNITGQYGAAASARAVAKYPKALAQLLRYTYTGKSTPAIDTYRAAGGSTGAAYLSDIERIGADIQHSYNDYVGATRLGADGQLGAAAGVATRKLVAAFTGWIEALNSATENAFRLAVFEALRGEHGINKAASAAKNSTVNFNRKGELGSAMGAMFLFFNPAVQGTAAMMSALVQGDHKWQARSLVAGLVGVTYALAALQFGDDEDDEFKKLPGFVKDRSIVIRLPAGRYITVPLPYGYAFAVTAGNALYSAAHGGDVDTISMGLASNIMENFSPVGNPLSGADRWRNVDPKGLLELLPGVPAGDLTKDAVRAISNRSGLGHQITPESHFDEGKPDHLKLFRATKASVFDKAARALSDATGGTQTQAGGIDVSPETLKFWIHAITGGAGAFLADSIKLGELGARKASGEEGDFAPELKEIPIARKFVRDADIRDSRSQYWDAANDAKGETQNFHRAKKAHDEAGMDKVEASGQAQLDAARSFIRYNKRIKRLRDEVDEIAQDDSLSVGMKRIKVKEIEAEEKSLYDEAVSEYGAGVRAERARAPGQR